MYTFTTEMEVRDYECDIQGIVNNANYLHYTEHTRHLFLKHAGLSFAGLHEKGVDAVVARMNLQYKTPLQCDDILVSKLRITQEGIRYVFHHDIFRKRDDKLSFRATAELVCLVNGRLSRSEDIDKAFAFHRTAIGRQITHVPVKLTVVETAGNSVLPTCLLVNLFTWLRPC